MVETRAMHAQRILGEKWNQIESIKDVFVDILLRLSAESLHSFRTVSKYWHKSICDKAFANMQLSRSRETLSFITSLHIDNYMLLYLMKPGETGTPHVISILGGSIDNGGSMSMICSFNGLICCIDDPSEGEEEVEVHLRGIKIRIYNPASGDSLLLPEGTPSLDTEPSIGVGYGPDISEYKVFRLFCVGLKGPEDHYRFHEGDALDGSGEIYRYECEMYSSITGSWRHMGQAPRIPMRFFGTKHSSTHVFVGDKIYWLVASRYRDIPGAVLSVDMEGNFRVFPLPNYDESFREEDGISPHTFLLDLKGSLCLLVVHLEDMIIWVLKEEAGEATWELKHEILHQFSAYDAITFATACGDTLKLVSEERWHTYDLGSKIWSHESPCFSLRSPVAFAYTESILPCNGGVSPRRR